MKFLFGCLLSAFLGGAYFCSYAQTGYSSVKGTVSTEDNQPAIAATVILLKFADSAIVKSAITNQAGQFAFDHIKPGSYRVLIHKIDYQRVYTGSYQLMADKTTDIGPIILQPINNQLKEVTITDKRDYIEVRPDKTVLNVDRSILAAGGNVYDILTTAPGVRVIDNAILLKGGQKALIAINGKPVGNLTDDQLAELLKSYPGSSISQIELIENPSAKYDAAGGGGVINIILKKSKDIGFRASVVESAAYGQDYKFSTGINLNYRTPKINFFGSYNFVDSKTPRMLDIDRDINTDGLLTNIDVNYHSTTIMRVNNFNAGSDYSITPKQTLGVLVYGYHNQAGIDKSSITHIANDGVLDSNLTTQSHIDRAITNLNYNLNYRGSFGKADETALSADVDYSDYNRSSFELLDNEFYRTDGSTYRDPLFYTDNSPSNIKVRSEKVDFSQALSKSSTLSAGLKNNQVNSDNQIDFEQREDSVLNFSPIPALTDHFVYNERINAAYVSYNDVVGKSDVTLGMRAEQTNSYGISYHPDRSVTRNYFDLFPNLQLTQTLDADNQLTLGYNRRIERPNYQDLNPFVGYISQYSYSTGNPFLKPEYYNTYAVSDLYQNKYKFSLSMVITKDFFAPVYQQNDTTKIYTTTYSNIGTYYVYEAEFEMPLTITKWWQADLDFRASYQRYVYNLDSARKSTYDINISLDQQFSITTGLKAQLFGVYESPTYYGIKQYMAQASAGAGLSQAVLDNKGTLRLNVSDIFNSDVFRYTSNYQNLDLTGREKLPTRFISLTFNYRFGKQSVKGPRSRVGGNADEQKRLGGSNNEN